MRNALAALFLLSACSTTTTAPPPPASTFPGQTPWSAPALARSEVPAVYAAQWEKAENRTTCDDCNHVEYGPEGGQGPNQLAYLRVSGQRCLYNIWSRLGQEHLEQLIRELRYVR